MDRSIRSAPFVSAVSAAAVVCCLWAIAPVRGQDEPSEERLRQQVARLIEQLDAPQRSTREQAEQELLDLGVEVLPHLPPLDSIESAEVRLRLARVREALARRRATKQFDPSHVTLHGRLPLSNILEQIQEQTGNELILRQPRRGTPETELALDQVPFWKALDAVCDKANLRMEPYGGERRIDLFAVPESSDIQRRPVSYAGAFRLAAKRVSLVRDLRESQARWCRLEMEVMWEPRLRPMFFQIPMENVHARDDKGKEISASSPMEVFDRELGPRMLFAPVTLDLQPPAPGARKLTRLQGQLKMTVAGHLETFRFPQPGKAADVSQQQGGIAVTLQSFVRNGQFWKADLRLQYPADLPAFDSHRSWVFSNEIYLETASGDRVRPRGGSSVKIGTEGAVMLQYRFNEVPVEQYTLVYKALSHVIELPVAFSFTDLPLP